MDKAALRADMIKRRKTIPEDDRLAAAHAVGVLFSQFKPFRQRSYGAYLSHDGELPTRHIMRRIFTRNARLSVPAWVRAEHQYFFFAFHAQMPVVTGHFGVREPAHRLSIPTESIALFLVPGLAFDEQGMRVGHGKGYYDILLHHAHPDAVKVGLCYDWQVVRDPIPAESHDIRMDWLLTDRRIICCRPRILGHHHPSLPAGGGVL